MYQAIADAVKKAAKVNKIKIVIPSGTAIQNARTSFIGDHLNRDGYHLDVKVGRYTAACTWFERIFKHNVVGNPYAPEGLDEARKAVAQKAAHAAVKHPYKVTDLSCWVWVRYVPFQQRIKKGVHYIKTQRLRLRNA